ncbi:MmcQ/YjbR family DNA-binding protein [Chryseobacterium sp. CT-SW4]|uniref:MmcQ/YjbR family DNA-binding protein n=1 Tax=Chryseobacterium sp. SW-1 TaxID=3157343 RepID=UPI003B023192
MEIDEIREYCLNKKGVTESFPFDNETLVMKVGTKIFILISLDSNPLSINVKTDPEWSQELRAQYPQITGAYHMNKTHWNSVMMDGVKKELILKLIDHSYDLVFSSLTKKAKEEILNS